MTGADPWRGRALSLVAAAVVTMTACSGSDTPPPTSTAPPVPTTAPSPAPTPLPTVPPTPAPATTLTALPPTSAPTTSVAPEATPTAAPAPTDPPSAPGTIILIGDLFFSPSALTVSVGDTVTWQNDGVFPHTTTAGVPGARTDEWHSGTLAAGESFSVTFDTPGTFSYFCSIHPNDMQATVTVSGG